ncbi:uroporphyrinogen decarboxylase family protein [Dysgonomonas sp. 511]|uniref:uroporphyrinogen decarboxylase family protein n=1 Tax=Dysgonomonas sp. 511 TaxID=2302930 RepID=UPI0013D093FA|nr:uroporphyrinogen decarboxylase family protein [Dysgonomonas sp. 511]NDV79720.1 methylcobamide--CoM methyltransferase [Dysgonomonas sp. 511]
MKWTDQILNSRKRLAIPVMTHPGIEAIGRTVKEAVTDGQVHYEAIKYLSDKYDIAACTAIMDLTVEAEAFGATAHLTDDEVPSITGRLVSDMESVEALAVPGMDAGRIAEYLKANRLAVENIKDKPILSGCIGPYSLAGRLYDMSEIMVGIYIEPDTINLLLEKCTQFIMDYCKHLKTIGTDGVIIAEPAAGLLSNDDCLEFSTKYVKQIVDAVQDDNFTVVLHNCGNTGQCTDAMIASGAKALHFGNQIDMTETLKVCPPDIIVMGNLDPVSVFKQATAEEVAAATTNLLEQTKPYKNFVISTGCDIPPHVPVENIEAFFAAVDKYNS